MLQKHRQKNLKHFNSQPHKEADEVVLELCPRMVYFNSQPHKEADVKNKHIWEKMYISTHSLTRRLTHPLNTPLSRIGNFNSQPHKEADKYTRIIRTRETISTHSLTRRLTILT